MRRDAYNRQMQALIERIRAEGSYLGRGIIKVDGFLNHQLDPQLTLGMGVAFKARFDAAGVTGITRIVSAEVSGIAPALATGLAYDVPVVYARKKKPITMADGVYEATAPSRTKGEMVTLRLSPEYLHATDRVLIIDDFLATGQTLVALIEMVQKSGAAVVGIGCVIEKTFEGGRERLAPLGIPLHSLAHITVQNDELSVR